MSSIALRSLALLLATAAVPAGAEPPQPDAPPETAEAVLARYSLAVVQRLQQDRVVLLAPGETDGVPDSFVQALVIFSQPRRRTLRLLSQTARQTEFRPELRQVETIEWDDTTALDEHRMAIMFVQIDYRLRTHFDFQRGRIWWELDPTFQNDLEHVEGFWQLYELGPNQTLGRFGTQVQVGAALPVWLQDYATRKNVPQTMEHVRRWVDSGGSYRP
jgi:hypothetical protein